jgi:alkanesulfonate monooxygenase SsuD/methylene tetrahydromethanopterin reductase-like flavin-dependent oxidoreductase (luciferase family)
MWADDRDAALATFPQPVPPPQIHLGVSGVELAELAGRRADGVNVPWAHPRRDALLAAARAARRDAAAPPGRLAVTTYAPFDEGLLDGDHAERRVMDRLGVDRLILVVRHPHPDELARTRPH